MGRPVKQLILSVEQQEELALNYRENKSHAFRKRCHMMLLKNEKRSSLDVANILGCCEVVVNSWMKRYEAEGIEGLKTKAGRGRKAILKEEDLEAVKRAVASNRQKLSSARATLETELEKSFSDKTLERYIKNMLHAINASDNVPYTKAIQRSMT